MPRGLGIEDCFGFFVLFVLNSQLFLTEKITQGSYRISHSEDDTNYFSLVVAFFMGHESVPLVHLGTAASHVSVPPLLSHMH